MEQDHQGNGGKGVESRLLITVLEQGRVFIKLNGRSRDAFRVGFHGGAQLIDEFLLIFVLPNVLDREDLNKKLASAADELIANGGGQVLRSEMVTIGADFQRLGT